MANERVDLILLWSPENEFQHFGNDFQPISPARKSRLVVIGDYLFRMIPLDQVVNFSTARRITDRL
jgi:hypothetical protein